MKLLLDEMFPAAIADALVGHGYDVIAVQADEALRELDDSALFAAAQQLGRAIVTENAKDFLPLDAVVHAQGETHYGLVFTTNRSFPRHRSGFIGALVGALGPFLDAHPGDDRVGAIYWLRPAR